MIRSPCVAMVLGLLGLSLSLPAAAGAAKLPSTTPLHTWVTAASGTKGVFAIAVSGGTAYLGGGFTWIGPRTGSFAALSTDGSAATRWPEVAGGKVKAVVADGKGGWFIGGSFTSAGGVRCAGLAHLQADRSVDRRFCPQPDDAVYALALEGSTLYAGGSFTKIAGKTRHGIAALAASSGAARPWLHSGDAFGSPYVRVYSLALSGSTLYAGGSFGELGGQPRECLAALDAKTGAATAWDAKLNPPRGYTKPAVLALAVSGGTLYLGGSNITSAGGQARANLAAVDTATGKPTAWNPGATHSIRTLEVSGSMVYAGGVSTLEAFDAASGERAAWAPPAVTGSVYALAAAGSTVYAGTDQGVSALDAASGKTVWTEPSDGPVATVATSSDGVFAGGSFTSVGGASRDGLAAIDLTTGQPTAWSPVTDIDGSTVGVQALAVSGSTVFVGGYFDKVGGAERNGLAAIDAKTGAVLPWNPGAGGAVTALALDGSTIFAAGSGYIEAVDQTSGRVLWKRSLGGDYAGGALAVGGGMVFVPTEFELKALDEKTGTPLAWKSPLEDDTIEALALVGPNLIVGGSFSDAAPTAGLSALVAKTGKRVLGWGSSLNHVDANSQVFSIASQGGTLFVAADWESADAGPSVCAAAVDAATGKKLAWDPGLEGCHPGTAVIATVAATPAAVVYGGSFVAVGAVSQSGFAAFPF